jgi:hypothetical protein
MCSYSGTTYVLNSYPLFRLEVSIFTVFSFAVYNVNRFILLPVPRLHFIWHSDQTTEKCKVGLLTKSTWNFNFQIIRNFVVEYDHEMKFRCTLIRTPASPLKFRMIDREDWHSPKKLSSLTVTESEYVMWFDTVACQHRNLKISISAVTNSQRIKFSEGHDHDK